MTKKKRMHPLAKIFIFALVLVAITLVVLYAFVGIRYVNDKIHELKFIGRLKNDTFVSGKLYYYDGRVATLNAEEKTIKSDNGEKYIGAISGYLPHGHGTLTKPDGTIFEGDFYEGYCTGNATVTYSNSDVYIGEVDHETRDGIGKYISSSKTTYDGEFRDGKKNGFGITSFSNGSVYIGEYKNSIKDGKGAYLFDSGDIYVGEFESDKRTGRGIYVWAKSEEYSSEFENLFNAEYSEAFKSSFIAYFEGDFSRHFLDTDTISPATTENTFFKGFENVLARKMIECYIGEFKENLFHGTGKYIWLSGRMRSGIYENGHEKTVE